jgi:hypothetical protein
MFSSLQINNRLTEETGASYKKKKIAPGSWL